jgi:hypothetical protein
VRARLTAALEFAESSTANMVDGSQPPRSENFRWATVLGLNWVRSLGEVQGTTAAATSRSLLDEWLLDDIVANALRGLEIEESLVQRGIDVIRILTTWQMWWHGVNPDLAGVARLAENWLHDDDVRRFLRVNRFGGALWYNKESLEDLLEWLLLIHDVERVKDGATLGGADSAEEWRAVFARVLQASDDAGYRVDRLLDILNPNRRGSGRSGRTLVPTPGHG